MSYGLKVWDADGYLVLDGADKSMRVVAQVPIRLGNQSGTRVVYDARVQASMKAIVQVLPGSYTGWGGSIPTRASVPSVRLMDGGIVLSGPSKTTYLANIDVILVAT